MFKRFFGPLTTLGLSIAALAFGLDQTVKWYFLFVFDLPERGRVQLTPFFDLVMAWNKGVSYGLLPTHVPALLIGLTLVICAFLLTWLAKASTPFAAAALGLIIGGALSNAFDRLIYGAVADFFYFHFAGLNISLLNFVFNPADIAIFCGVCLLIYHSFIEKPTEQSH